MKLGKLNTKIKRIIQAENNINRVRFSAMLALGFPANRARKYVLDEAGITMNSLIGPAAKRVSLYGALNGWRPNNMKAKKVLADAVGLTVEEFFPEMRVAA